MTSLTRKKPKFHSLSIFAQPLFITALENSGKVVLVRGGTEG